MEQKKVGSRFLLVSPISSPKKEEKIGSIIIPDTVKHKSKMVEGVVINRGTGTKDKPMEAEIGDHIMYMQNANRPKVDDMELIEMSDILFVL